jgi:hypothetical protein
MRTPFFIVLFLFVFIACESENREDLVIEPDNCETENVKYSTNIQSVLATKCGSSSCHGGPDGIGGLDLRSYDDVNLIAGSGTLTNRTTGNGVPLMPPAGSIPLTTCEKEQINAWVTSGANNN